MTIRLTESYLVEVGFSARLVFGPTVSFHLRAGLIWREQLISELEALTDAEALAAWAERVHAELVGDRVRRQAQRARWCDCGGLNTATVAGDGSGSETVAATHLQNSTAV